MLNRASMLILFILLTKILMFNSSSVLAEQNRADYVDEMNIEFILIKPGKFVMGRDASVKIGYDPELPAHEVKIKQPFYLAKYETTQAQWQLVMNNNPANFVDPQRPVENVSFKDIQKYINKLNKLYPNLTYRLPTEAQWEYAVRAGTDSVYFFGASEGWLSNYGWYIGNTPGGTQPVGLLAANAWGLHDMYGNVAEWVEDCWHVNYIDAPKDGSSWLDNTDWFTNNCKERVLRGGSWFSPAFELRSAYRFKHFNFNRSQHKGFRLALDKSTNQ